MVTQLIIVPHNIQLTNLQIEQLQLFANGYVDKDIAIVRNCSVSAVKKVTQDIFAKFNVNTRSEAIAHGFRYGILK